MLLSTQGLRAAQALTRVVPRPIAGPLVRVGSLGYGRASSDTRTLVERNLRRAYGDRLDERRLGRSVDAVFENYGRYWLDSLRLTHMDTAGIERGFHLDGLEHITAAFDTGTAPILALPHLGGWEWAAAWLTKVQGWKVAAVAERLEPPELYEWFLDYRSQLGMRVIPLGPAAGGEVAAALAARSIVCLLSDRDLKGDGIEVEFFGERTRIPGGPAVMALRSGAPLLPVAAFFDGDGCRGLVLPPLDTERRGRLRQDVQRVTQDLAAALETLIRMAPEQWHLLQPNWPSDYDAIGQPRPEWFREL
jgi:lauroyl/myristoyl acyltransferase